MGVSDGVVSGITKVLDNGPNDSRMNIVLLAEGFTDAEQSNFNDRVDEFVAALQAEPWFSTLGSAINVHRINVSSTDSGADDPTNCEDDSTGTGTTAATYFDASYCRSGVRRCILGDTNLVRDTLDEWIPEWHAAAVLVNHSQYGGCASNGVSFTAVNGDWELVVLHELGHAAFALADEYHYRRGCSSDEDRANPPSGEPAQRNITAVVEREDLKWRFFVGASTPVPTMVNPDCAECDERPNVLDDDDTIGLYEGAGTWHCGRFRPAYRCRMRDHHDEFCRVCVDAIAETLKPFLPGEPDIEIVSTALDFGDVVHGLTTYRSFTLRNIRGAVAKSVEITLGAITGSAGFAYPSETDLTFRLPAPVLENSLEISVFVAFTSSAGGAVDHSGSLLVSGPGTSDLPRTVSLEARSIAPVPIDSVLVVDRSGSMSEETGVPGKQKIDLAIDAGHLFVNLLKDTDGIGVVRYNDQASNAADVLLGLRPATSAGRSLANNALSRANLEPDGATSVGAGILLGADVIDSGSAENRALIVLTDGIQNTDPSIEQGTAGVITLTPRPRVFSVGFGLNQLEDALQEIATVTNGSAHITGDVVDQWEFLLHKLYVQILADIADEAFVTDPVNTLLPQQKQSTSIRLAETDVSADIIVVFRRDERFPKHLAMWLEGPDGTIINKSTASALPTCDVIHAEDHVIFRWLFPVFPDRPDFHKGRWRFWMENRSGRPCYYSVMVKARSDLRLNGRVEQIAYAPGTPFDVVLEPTLYGLPIALDAPVKVNVRRPDGAVFPLALARQPNGSYRGTYPDTGLVGGYSVTAEAWCTSPAGHRIARYRQMTGLIFRPRRPQPDEKSMDCCKELAARLDRLIHLLERR